MDDNKNCMCADDCECKCNDCGHDCCTKKTDDDMDSEDNEDEEEGM